LVILRIAFDIAALDLGGAERQTLEVAAGLSELGHDVLLIVNKRAEHFAEYFDRVQIVELHRTQRWDVRVVADIRHALHAFHADVCVCVLFNATLWGRLAAASLGCEVVVAEHSTKARTPCAERVANILLRGATKTVIACAEAQVDALARGGHQRCKMRVVRNGVSVSRFARDAEGGIRLREQLRVPQEAPLIMLVAAHRPEKRHDRFVSLIEQLHRTGTCAWGVMVGGGPSLGHTAALVKASSVAQWLRVAGPIVDMPAAYSAADVVVLVSDDVETFPLTFLEAQACEVPVVGMDAGGVRETMIEGQTGFVVEQGDLQSMARITAALLADEGRRADIGSAGRRFVMGQLSTEAMVNGYASLLANVTEQGPTPPHHHGQ
jgi:glycosyltransferase involved in cell wall biosynthesis